MEDNYLQLSHTLGQARSELNNIRKSLHVAKGQFKNDFNNIEVMIKNLEEKKTEESNNQVKELCCNCFIPIEPQQYTLKSIGFIKSVHRQKNATPRQGSISTLSRGELKIEKSIFNNPSHALEGLQEYSHVWLIYIFHQNKSEGTHAKVAPPRLDGEKLGVYATRSPHRPNAIGLTLACLDKVEGDTVFVSGIDLLDGTPVVDIKPFIPRYDSPQRISNQSQLLDEFLVHNSNIQIEEHLNVLSIQNNYKKNGFTLNNPDNIERDSEDNIILTDKEDTLVSSECEDVATPQWLDSPPSSRLEVLFNPIAEEQIAKFSCSSENVSYRLEYLKSSMELRSAISSALSEDPRSSYRRQKCSDRLYFFMVDSAHITAFFCGNEVEVLRVCPPDKDNPYYKLM